MRRSSYDFLKEEEDKEETRSLYEGEKDELTFLQPLLGLESIMSLIRRFREPTFGPSPPLPLPLFSPLFSLCLSPFSGLLQAKQSWCNPIDPTGHIRAVTVMPHRVEVVFLTHQRPISRTRGNPLQMLELRFKSCNAPSNLIRHNQNQEGDCSLNPFITGMFSSFIKHDKRGVIFHFLKEVEYKFFLNNSPLKYDVLQVKRS